MALKRVPGYTMNQPYEEDILMAVGKRIIADDGTGALPGISSLTTFTKQCGFVLSDGAIGLSVDGVRRLTVTDGAITAGVQIESIAGTAAAPGVIVGGEQTGIYLSSAGVLGLSTSGVARALLSSTALALQAGVGLTATYAAAATGGTPDQDSAAIRLTASSYYGVTANENYWNIYADSEAVNSRANLYVMYNGVRKAFLEANGNWNIAGQIGALAATGAKVVWPYASTFNGVPGYWNLKTVYATAANAQGFYDHVITNLSTSKIFVVDSTTALTAAGSAIAVFKTGGIECGIVDYTGFVAPAKATADVGTPDRDGGVFRSKASSYYGGIANENYWDIYAKSDSGTLRAHLAFTYNGGGVLFKLYNSGSVEATAALGGGYINTTSTTVGWQIASGGYGGIHPKADNGVMWGVASGTNTQNRNVILTDYLNYAKDHYHNSVSTHPTFWVHSVTDPTAGDAAQWLSLTHTTTRGVIDSGKHAINIVPGTAGGNGICSSEATVTLSGASGRIEVNVPIGAIRIGVQLRVDTAITSGDGGVSWDATWDDGAPLQAICTGQAFTKQTKVSQYWDPTADTPICDAETDIVITPDAGTFSGGVVRAIAYYWSMETMADAV